MHNKRGSSSWRPMIIGIDETSRIWRNWSNELDQSTAPCSTELDRELSTVVLGIAPGFLFWSQDNSRLFRLIFYAFFRF